MHIKIHRKRSVSSEAFYVALAVTEEGRRDVLGIFNIPTESVTGWSDIFDTLKERGVQTIGFMVADGIKGLDVVVGWGITWNAASEMRSTFQTQYVC